MTTSRIYAYRWPARLVSHKPFAAERYSITSSCIWQVFFRKKNEFSFLFSLFCQRAHFLCKMHNPHPFCGWKTPLLRVCWDSMGGKGGGYTYYIGELPQSKPVGFASFLGEGAFGLVGRFLIAFDTLVTELTACALSVKPCRACQLSQRESQEHCQKLSHYT